MNERQILALKATIELGTTNGAAQLIGISQPAVSQLLSNLESEVGFALFDRRQGKIRPTPQGKRFLGQAHSILDAFEATRQTADALRGLSVGNIRIGCTVGFAIHIMPAVIARLHKRHPHINTSLQARPSNQIREMTQHGIFDIGLFESDDNKGFNPNNQIVIPSVCVFKAGDELTQKQTVHPEDLIGRKLVSLYSRHKSSQRQREIFLEAGLPWKPVVETNLFAAACEFVSKTDAVAIVDPFTPRSFIEGKLETRPFDPVVPITLSIIRSTTGRHGSFLDELQGEIFKTFTLPEK